MSGARNIRLPVVEIGGEWYVRLPLAREPLNDEELPNLDAIPVEAAPRVMRSRALIVAQIETVAKCSQWFRFSGVDTK